MNIIRQIALLSTLMLAAASAHARHPMSIMQQGWHTAGTNQGDLLQVNAHGIEQTGQVIEFWARMRIEGSWSVSRAAVACSEQRYVIVAFLHPQTGDPVMMDGEDLPISPGSNVDVLARAVCGQHGMALGGPAPIGYRIPSDMRPPVARSPDSYVGSITKMPPAAPRQRDPDCATGKRAIWSPACQ